MVLELGFRLTFVCIQNFELIHDIFPCETFLKPSISSLKQPAYWKKNSNIFQFRVIVLSQTEPE